MAIVVVGGSGRGVGKTALVCGLIAALPEFHWTALKITSHAHGLPGAIFEESRPGQGSDTARYLKAGAHRALLVTAGDEELEAIVARLVENQPRGTHLLFESNRILNHLRPDLCLAVDGSETQAPGKPSFRLAAGQADALVVHGSAARMVAGEEDARPIFYLAAMDRISPEMLVWIRVKLRSSEHHEPH